MNQSQLKIAVINEAECIGCTKCIQACPFDAIFGAQKYIHTVISEACVGCNLCVPACPVDCITMESIPSSLSKKERVKRAKQARVRFQARAQRLQNSIFFSTPGENNKKTEIAEAIARTKIKKQAFS